jgi:uncharacterized protein (TIGR02996 family)
MTRAAFLADIVANPDDDTPRLVYADWLDENGDPDRAEFIRAQIELHRLAADSPRYAELLARQRLLLEANKEAWEAGLPKAPGIGWWRWSRGFVSGVRISSAKACRDHGATLFAATPIQELELGGQVTARTLPGILASPWLASLRRLAVFRLSLGEASAQAIAYCPGLAGLRSLFLGSCGIGPSGAAALARSPHLKHLRELHLAGNPLGDEGVDRLVSSPLLGQVEVLHLHSTQLGHAGIAALARSSYVSALRELLLGNNRIGDFGARTLAGSSQLKSLALLTLIANGITDSGAEALASMTGLPALTELHLGGNPITNAGAAALAAGRALDRLKRLTFYTYTSQIGPEGVAALHESFGDRVEIR